MSLPLLSYSSLPAFFLLLDVIPDYIQETFAITEEGRFDERNPDLRMIHEGETIPKDLDFAVIIFNGDDYHSMSAYELSSQIRAINPSARVLLLPVQG